MLQPKSTIYYTGLYYMYHVKAYGLERTVIFQGLDVVPICRVSLITSRREEQALMAANNVKPVIKLIINR